jgi:hypothetical protein
MALQTSYFKVGLTEVKVKIGASLKAVKGIKTLNIDVEGWSTRAEGDDMALLAMGGNTGFAKGTAEFAVCDMETINFLTGETAVNTGVTPNQVATNSVHGDTVFPEFSIEGRTTHLSTYGAGTIPADTHIKVHHCVLTKRPNNLNLKMSKEGLGVFSFEFDCWADQTTKHLVDNIDYETATAIT